MDVLAAKAESFGFVVDVKPLHVIGAPILGVLVGLVLCLFLTDARGPISFPLIVAVGAVANRVCVRSGLIAATLAALAFNFFMAPPVYEFSIPTWRQLVLFGCMYALAFIVAPRRPRSGCAQVYDRNDDLPFTSRSSPNGKDGLHRGVHDNGLVYWDVRPTGDWRQDCEIGIAYARMYIDRAVRGEPRPLLCWVIRDMVRTGRFGGVETGFAQGLAHSYAGLAMPKRSTSPEYDAKDPWLHHGVGKTNSHV